MFCKFFLTALVALVATITLAGPVRLATSFFISSGRTNPIILDAKVDANGNLVTAAQADFGGGFRYKTVTHITLKSIAQNAEIDAIAAEIQPKIDAALAEINKLFGKDWKEWEVPRTLDQERTEESTNG